MFPIEHLTQIGTGANNCAPAWVAMCVNLYRPSLGLSVQDVDRKMDNGTGFTSMALVRDTYIAYDIPAIISYEADVTWHMERVYERKPTTVLGDYRAFDRNPPPTLSYQYLLAHIFGAVGFDANRVYLHDPLYLSGMQEVTYTEFDNAVNWQSEYPMYDKVTKKRLTKTDPTTGRTVYVNGKNPARCAVVPLIPYSRNMDARRKMREVLESMPTW
jgi:hypothetical protein